MRRNAFPAATPVPSDPMDWRPQLARHGISASAVRDPILEPAWDGRHVLAHLGDRVRLIDALGEDATLEEPPVIQALEGALLAADAVVDGFLTDQASRSGQGASLALRAEVSRMASIMPRSADVEVVGMRDDGEERAVAFVAVDLLRVDGQELFDVPLLERKRLLESVLAPAELVRVSAYTRPPVKPWLASWKAAGFAGVMLKAANSRYLPASLCDEWALLTTLGR
jgi:ATP-dependent DNA ligase